MADNIVTRRPRLKTVVLRHWDFPNESAQRIRQVLEEAYKGETRQPSQLSTLSSHSKGQRPRPFMKVLAKLRIRPPFRIKNMVNNNKGCTTASQFLIMYVAEKMKHSESGQKLTGKELTAYKLSEKEYWKNADKLDKIFTIISCYNDDNIRFVEQPEKAYDMNYGAKKSSVHRQQWDRPIEFLLSCVSISVGLANVWRFPFTAYENGGGAFLIPYLVVVAFIGRPLYLMELTLGQFCSYGPIKVWNVVPLFKGIGVSHVLCGYLISAYYTSTMAVIVFYFFASFQTQLPWSICDSSWGATSNCSDHFTNRTKLEGKETPSEQYLRIHVLHTKSNINDGIGTPDMKLSSCLLLTWFIIGIILIRGVHSLGKASYFLALFPYTVLIALLVHGSMLDGAWAGMKYFIRPDWGKLLDPKIWYIAMVQGFQSLSVGVGTLIIYASYNPFSHNIYRDAIILIVTDTLTSCLAGLSIFAILGNLAHELDVDVKDVVRSGMGLVFISYPAAITKFTFLPQLFSALFFMMMFSLGLGCCIAMTSCVISVICDQHPVWNSSLVTLCVCISGFIVGLVFCTPGGQFVLRLVDYFGGGIVLLVLTLAECVAISWFYGVSNFCKDIEFMNKIKLLPVWKFCWKYFIPTVLIAVIVYGILTMEPLTYLGEPYPTAAIVFGWLIMGIELAQIPFWAVVVFFKEYKKSFKHTIKKVLKHSNQWGPKQPDQRRDWLIYRATE